MCWVFIQKNTRIAAWCTALSAELDTTQFFMTPEIIQYKPETARNWSRHGERQTMGLEVKKTKSTEERRTVWKIKRNIATSRVFFFFLKKHTAQNETVYFGKVKIFRQVAPTFSDSRAIFIHDDYTTKRTQVNEMISLKIIYCVLTFNHCWDS